MKRWILSFVLVQAQALAKFGEPAAKYIPDILNFLKDEKVDSNVRSGAAQALAKFGEPAAKYIPDILNFLKDEKVDSNVRSGAAKALAEFGESAAKYIPDILNIFKDEQMNPLVRKSAAQVLDNFGEATAKYIPDILIFFRDKSFSSYSSNELKLALNNFGKAGVKYIPDIFNFLKNKKLDQNFKLPLVEALVNFRQLDLEEVVVVLNNLYDPSHSQYKEWRFLTYVAGGGTKEVKTLLTWLGYSQTVPQQLKYDEAKETLEVFLEVWKPTKELRRLRNDLADKIGRIAKDKSFTWKALDISLLQKHHDNLKIAGYNEADTIQRIINNLQFWKWFFITRNIILIHLAIWLTLILIYPTFTPVLAPLFWNLWLRRILGFGYIGLLLTLVPWFRERLLQPFKPLLLADAGLDNFVEQGYFGESYVKVPPGSIPVLDQNQNLLDNTITVVATTESNPEIFRPLSLINPFSKHNILAFVTIINIFLQKQILAKAIANKNKLTK